MLEPRRSRVPVLAGTFNLVLAVFVLGTATILLFGLFGWAVHTMFFMARVAVIVGLFAVGARLLMRTRR
jgi:hypothetical protein